MNSAIDISNVVLKTERLIIRPWKLSDLNDFYDYCKVDGVGQWAGWYPHKNKEESLVILNSFINNKNTFCLEYEGKAIGSIGIEKYNEELYDEFSALHGRELGFVLSKDYWGKGLMTEAVKKVIIFIFKEADLDFIACGHYKDNIASARVQSKAGFSFYREYRRKRLDGTDTVGIANIMFNNLR